MKPESFLDLLEGLLVPSEYGEKIVEAVPKGWRFYRKGAYIFAAVPYDEPSVGDYKNSYVKTAIRKIVFAMPLFAEKGLFLLHYGPEEAWGKHASLHQVDKTALRPIIMQSSHFVDAETGANLNSRTSWGPVKFGFSSGVIAKVESACSQISQSQPE